MEESGEHNCIHYWIIESPAYKKKNYRATYDSLTSWSRGVCKKCKEERIFDNSSVTKQLNIISPATRLKQEKEKENSLQNGEN